MKRQSDGIWESPLQLVGSISPNDVYVIINSSAQLPKLIQEKDLEVANVTPMTFNGNDRVGLFKNDVLIDIIGDLDGTDDFALNITLRRNSDISAPNLEYSEQAEWEFFEQNNVEDIGTFSSTLSVNDTPLLEDLEIYPNPINSDVFFIKTEKNATVTIYNVLGKKLKSATITADKNSIDVSNLSKGIFIIKINIETKSFTKKLIKN
jgi:hypothetical protein